MRKQLLWVLEIFKYALQAGQPHGPVYNARKRDSLPLRRPHGIAIGSQREHAQRVGQPKHLLLQLPKLVQVPYTGGGRAACRRRRHQQQRAPGRATSLAARAPRGSTLPGACRSAEGATSPHASSSSSSS